MDDPGSSTPLLAVLFLLVANALLAAAEFSLIAVRRSRLERPGDAAARALPAPSRLEELAFAAQVGRSLASLLLGWLSALLATRWLLPLGILNATGAALVGVVAAALLHAVLGQQVPKLVAVHRAERLAPRLAVPLELLRRALWPVLWVLGGTVRGSARLLGVRDPVFLTAEPSAEELRAMVEQASGRTEIEEEEREMIRGVFEFRETVAREVMTPRTEVVAVPADVSLDELLRVVTEEGHSRIPVYEGTVDHVVGVLLVKDLLPFLAGREPGAGEGFSLRALLREPLFVPDTKPVNALLSELRSHGVHLAVVVDEFGGTYGLVTMEDLLEEIVGEIRDEYDEASEAEPEWEPTPEGDVLIDGAASIGEVNERFGLALPEEDFDTVGGYVFGALGRLPVEGDAVPVEGPEGRFELRVEETEERRVSTLRLSRVVPEEAHAAPAEPAPAPAHAAPVPQGIVVSHAGASAVTA